MAKSRSEKKKQTKRQSDKSRLSLSSTQKKKRAATTKKTSSNSSVKHYKIRISPSKRLMVSIKLQKVTLKPRSNRKKPNVASRLHRALPAFFIILGLIGTAYFSVQIRKSRNPIKAVTFSIPVPKQSTAKPTAVKNSLPKSEPTQIKIRSVGIDYAVKPVGKLADGTMETPPVLEFYTGWYKYSPTPGEIGPSVIVGHVDSYKGVSVFWRLKDVKAGDLVEISRKDGKTATFKVRALKQFDQDNFPTQEVYGNVDDAELRLITCGGTFNKATGHYTDNTVVFASLSI